MEECLPGHGYLKCSVENGQQPLIGCSSASSFPAFVCPFYNVTQKCKVYRNGAKQPHSPPSSNRTEISYDSVIEFCASFSFCFFFFFKLSPASGQGSKSASVAVRNQYIPQHRETRHRSDERTTQQQQHNDVIDGQAWTLGATAGRMNQRIMTKVVDGA